MSTYIVVINDGTLGSIDSDTLDGNHPSDFMGEYMTIHSRDENGNPIEHYGRLTEIVTETGLGK